MGSGLDHTLYCVRYHIDEILRMTPDQIEPAPMGIASDVQDFIAGWGLEACAGCPRLLYHQRSDEQNKIGDTTRLQQQAAAGQAQ